MRTLIRGGTVVNPTGPQPADVLIDGETITAVLSPGLSAEIAADEVVDAAGCYVIPGGVDAHTHMTMDYSAYEGISVAGAVRTVLSRGTRVIDGGQSRGQAGHGQYLPRGLSSYLRLSVSQTLFWRCQQWNSASSCRLPRLPPRWWSTRARRN